jgi:hypothetical protein
LSLKLFRGAIRRPREPPWFALHPAGVDFDDGVRWLERDLARVGWADLITASSLIQRWPASIAATSRMSLA